MALGKLWDQMESEQISFNLELINLNNDCVKTYLLVLISLLGCHGIVPCNMSPNDVRPLDVNTVNGSWSVHKREVSRMEVNLVLLYGIPKYNNVSGVGENATKSVVF
jgi:hypothetical protein